MEVSTFSLISSKPPSTQAVSVCDAIRGVFRLGFTVLVCVQFGVSLSLFLFLSVCIYSHIFTRVYVIIEGETERRRSGVGGRVRGEK